MGPAVFGYETDMPLRRAAQISVHTSPLATLGGKDVGGMNVYVRELSCHLARLGLPVTLHPPQRPRDTRRPRDDSWRQRRYHYRRSSRTHFQERALHLSARIRRTDGPLFLEAGVRYDVVHAHYWLSGWVAELARRYWSTPFVQMFHTTAHMKNAVAAAADRETDLRLRTEKRLLTLADGIIAANPDGAPTSSGA